MDNNRLPFLDISRGIGILMVMYSHSLYNNATIMTYVSGCYIPLFFVISGYLAKPTTGGGYFFHRIKYLLGPYFIFSILLGMLYYCIHGNVDAYNIIGVFYSRFYLYPSIAGTNVKLMEMWNSPMWFLTAMVVTLLLWNILNANRKYIMYYFSVFLVSIFLMMQLPVLLPWSIDVAPLFALMMLSGYEIRKHGLINLNWKFLILGAILYVIICYFNGDLNLSIRVYGLSPIGILLSGVLGSFIIIRSSIWIEKIEWLARFLSIIGRNSISVFCTHVFVFSILSNAYLVLNVRYGLFIPAYILLVFDLLVASVSGIIISFLLKKYVPYYFR